MAGLTIRNLDEPLKGQLRIRAARHGRSMEDEVREILRAALAEEPRRSADLAATIHRRFKALGDADLPVPGRDAMRDPPDFGE